VLGVAHLVPKQIKKACCAPVLGNKRADVYWPNMSAAHVTLVINHHFPLCFRKILAFFAKIFYFKKKLFLKVKMILIFKFLRTFLNFTYKLLTSAKFYSEIQKSLK
jgi:hypothetical protein